MSALLPLVSIGGNRSKISLYHRGFLHTRFPGIVLGKPSGSIGHFPGNHVFARVPWLMQRSDRACHLKARAALKSARPCGLEIRQWVGALSRKALQRAPNRLRGINVATACPVLTPTRACPSLAPSDRSRLPTHVVVDGGRAAACDGASGVAAHVIVESGATTGVGDRATDIAAHRVPISAACASVPVDASPTSTMAIIVAPTPASIHRHMAVASLAASTSEEQPAPGQERPPAGRGSARGRRASRRVEARHHA